MVGTIAGWYFGKGHVINVTSGAKYVESYRWSSILGTRSWLRCWNEVKALSSGSVNSRADCVGWFGTVPFKTFLGGRCWLGTATAGARLGHYVWEWNKVFGMADDWLNDWLDDCSSVMRTDRQIDRIKRRSWVPCSVIDRVVFLKPCLKNELKNVILQVVKRCNVLLASYNVPSSIGMIPL